MTKTGDMILHGLQEAILFAHDACDHDWRDLKTDDNRIAQRKECRRCGIRLTTYLPRITPIMAKETAQ